MDQDYPVWYNSGKRSNNDYQITNKTKKAKNEYAIPKDYENTIKYYCKKIIEEDSYEINFKQLNENKVEIKISLKDTNWFNQLDKDLQKNIIYNLKSLMLNRINKEFSI